MGPAIVNGNVARHLGLLSGPRIGRGKSKACSTAGSSKSGLRRSAVQVSAARPAHPGRAGSRGADRSPRSGARGDRMIASGREVQTIGSAATGVVGVAKAKPQGQEHREHQGW